MRRWSVQSMFKFCCKETWKMDSVWVWVCELALQAFVPVLQNHNLETICKDWVEDVCLNWFAVMRVSSLLHPAHTPPAPLCSFTCLTQHLRVLSSGHPSVWIQTTVNHLQASDWAVLTPIMRATTHNNQSTTVNQCFTHFSQHLCIFRSLQY